MNFELSVIIPIYNEELILQESIQNTINTLLYSGIHFEVILVNDGSKDNSQDILEVFNKYEYVKIVNHDKNYGFGKAIISGINHCILNYILCIPVDSPLNYQDLKLFIDFIDDADILLSYRDKRK